MLGFAGFPLTGGFFGKLFVFSAAYEAGEWWLVLVGVAATAVSLAYYLNVVRWMYMRSGAELPVLPRAEPRPERAGVASRPRSRPSSPSDRSSRPSRSSTWPSDAATVTAVLD